MPISSKHRRTNAGNILRPQENLPAITHPSTIWYNSYYNLMTNTTNPTDSASALHERTFRVATMTGYRNFTNLSYFLQE